jgi:AmiR/NasT family two-component response regulator
VIERAKGVLMERHGIDEEAAFEALRSHARRNNQKIVEVADAVIDGHLLLPPRS